MREIKFKAFHKQSKKMFDVVLIDFLNGFVFNYEEIFGMSKHSYSYSDTISYELKDCELLQYTGLKDCDGKDIYEGDIVEIKNKYYKPSKPIVVIWGKKSHGYRLKACQEMSLSASKDIKILGNIYENPELLEVK